MLISLGSSANILFPYIVILCRFIRSGFLSLSDMLIDFGSALDYFLIELISIKGDDRYFLGLLTFRILVEIVLKGGQTV